MELYYTYIWSTSDSSLFFARKRESERAKVVFYFRYSAATWCTFRPPSQFLSVSPRKFYILVPRMLRGSIALYSIASAPLSSIPTTSRLCYRAAFQVICAYLSFSLFPYPQSANNFILGERPAPRAEKSLLHKVLFTIYPYNTFLRELRRRGRYIPKSTFSLHLFHFYISQLLTTSIIFVYILFFYFFVE